MCRRPPALLSLSFAGDLVDSAEAAHPDACATLVADLPAGTYDVGVQGLPGKDVFAHTLQASLRPAE